MARTNGVQTIKGLDVSDIVFEHKDNTHKQYTKDKIEPKPLSQEKVAKYYTVSHGTLRHK